MNQSLAKSLVPAQIVVCRKMCRNITHPSYVNGLRKVNDTHLVSNHRLPQDLGETVEIHRLFYNVYWE